MNVKTQRFNQMKLTLTIKLDPTQKQHQALLKTMERFNKACNDIAEVAYINKTANKFRLQKILYYRIREQYKLSSQMTIRAIGKVVEAYKRDKSIKPSFRLYGAMVYDARAPRTQNHICSDTCPRCLGTKSIKLFSECSHYGNALDK